MPSGYIRIDSAWKKAAAALIGVALIAAAWFTLKAGMANSAALRVEDAEVALYLTELAPDDPQPHFVAAIHLEKSFDPKDIERALREYEKAAALAPENFLFWLELGRARERSGDAEGAEAALRRALALAPNYSRVQWALGNALLRQGRTAEAFAEIKKSVSGDPTFAGPAAATAWQFFDGDIEEIRRSVGGSSLIDAALVALLVREKKFDRAVEIWSTLPSEQKPTVLKDTGAVLQASLLGEKKFGDALRVAIDLHTGEEGMEHGKIVNGGFESAVKPDGAGPFDWQIAAGLQPQIVLSSGQKHSGNNSLVFVFNSGDGKDFRSVSQTVAVAPGGAYEFQVFYRSDLKTAAVFRWEIVDAADGGRLAVTEPVVNGAEWKPLTANFRMPAGRDGITVRLIRENCGQVCAVAGNLSFDDVTLRATGK